MTALSVNQFSVNRVGIPIVRGVTIVANPGEISVLLARTTPARQPCSKV